jgi:hypothetical protein
MDTPLGQVFPVFGVCSKKAKTTTESEPLLDGKKQNKKQGFKLDEEQKEDPFNFLGFGMVAYRDLMFTLFCLFGFCSLLMVPALNFYSKGVAYTEISSYENYSLGNMGYSST